ncbi:Metallo-hydrolase/oxidoreductase [Clavulina sp. PMI_390]|nr:Metallo-hydrolase/oxidoreductase [Clavulina sp. PMI_390]
MPKSISVTFLGTSSGGGPSSSRACSSLAISLDSEIWLIDCAEGTQVQLAKAGLKHTRITKIFVSHLHGDHVLGIVPLMCTMMYGFSPTARRVDLFGPSGLRQLIRTTLTITQANLMGRFAIHELLHLGENPSCSTEPRYLHPNELPGMDIHCDADGQWKAIDPTSTLVRIDAGPILHRVPCIGYVFTEPPRPEPYTQEFFEQLDRNGPALLAQGIRNPRALLARFRSDGSGSREPILLPDGTLLQPPVLSIPGRKLVMLGDTSDPSGVVSLAMDASLLVHEATNAYVDSMGDVTTDEDERLEIRDKAISRGHSTADMAGTFARSIHARRLYLNHFSTK